MIRNKKVNVKLTPYGKKALEKIRADKEENITRNGTYKQDPWYMLYLSPGFVIPEQVVNVIPSEVVTDDKATKATKKYSKSYMKDIDMSEDDEMEENFFNENDNLSLVEDE